SLTTDADFSGRKFATPQWGNTQDIALKHYLLVRGHRTLDEGGDVDVINAANPEILTLFKLGQIDGAWVPEPWGTRLVQEANAKVILDERDLWPGRQFVTTQLVTTKRYLERHPDVITSFLRTYVNLTLQLQRATASDLWIINDEIYNLTTSRLKEETITAAFVNFNVTYVPIARRATRLAVRPEPAQSSPQGEGASPGEREMKGADLKLVMLGKRFGGN